MVVGLFGKLPSHGDFLRRRASDTFVDAWDAWLQACLTASRSSLGERWLDAYLTSPAWRFVCASGMFNRLTAVGVMAPSVDLVGRYFPLTLVAELPGHVDPVAAATEAERFFEGAERLVIETLAAEHVDFEAFDERVVALGEELEAVGLRHQVMLGAGAWNVLNDGAAISWQLPIGSSAQLAPALDQLLSQRLSRVYQPLSLWWTEGSSMVEPTCLILKGLPRPDAFGAMLDGSWDRHSWQSIPAEVDGTGVPAESTAPETMPYRFRSAAATEVGPQGEVGRYACLERPEVGLWVVAEGKSGPHGGENAARMVCDALADFAPQASLDDMVDATGERLQEVNRHLFRTATRSPFEGGSSSVVVLLARGGQCALLWAGDGRAYRWRAGRLEQLTDEPGSAPRRRRETHGAGPAVTGAVGVESSLVLDLCHEDVRVGDRLLLCSPTVTRAVSPARIESLMDRDVPVVVQELVDAALGAGAVDGVAVLVAEACADGQ